MDHNFNNKDFERFLKQNADQYRMFPSERIWNGIHDALHTRRRWFGIGLALLLLTSAVVTLIMVSPGGHERTVASTGKTSKAIDQKPITGTVTGNDKTGPVPPSRQPGQFIISPERIIQTGYTANATEPDDVLVRDAADKIDERPTGIIETISPVLAEVSMKKNPPLALPAKQPVLSAFPSPAIPKAIPTAAIETPESTNRDLTKTEEKTPNLSATAPAKTADKNDLRMPQIPERKAKALAKTNNKRKLGWQLYLTPTVSYRTLSENTAFISQARFNSIVNGTGGGTAYYSTDVNSMVNHRPNLGFQLGIRTSYPLSRWFSFTGGLQLSVSKYNIRAYEHPAEMATIALLDRSVSTVSNLRNTNGYKESWLHNFYFAASLPVGAELRLSDGSRNYFGIAGTLQPTYVLDNRAYLISTDYKNYAEIPSLIRHWNMNTSFEIFSAQKTGKVNWRIGPQVRYQLMSSFSKNYPIREHLFDFGIKLGVQLK